MARPHVIEQGWLLTGKAVYFRPGTTPLKQTYDLETQAYLDAWFSRSLFKRPEFKGVRFVQTLWPRDTPRTSKFLSFSMLSVHNYRLTAMGVVLAKMRLASNKEAREARLRRQQDWVGIADVFHNSQYHSLPHSVFELSSRDLPSRVLTIPSHAVSQ